MPGVVKYRKISPFAHKPQKATSGAAAFDLYSSEELIIPVGKSVLVGTGLVMEIPPGYEGQIRPRSGLAKKSFLTIPNSPGTIDSDYRGEVKVLLFNGGYKSFEVFEGVRIAQMVIAAVPEFVFEEASEELSDTDRGSGGFGSTGLSELEEN